MRRVSTACLLTASTLVLSACAAEQGSFPSLARRPAERIAETPPAPHEQPVPVPPDPALIARIEVLETMARAADARFRARTAQARALISAAAGAPIASEEWSVATIALSELEAARSEAMIALAEIDSLHARAVIEETDSAALATAREKMVAMVSEEDRALADLGAGLAD